MKLTHCVDCKEIFSDRNVYSEEGWRETQMSGMCEICFDNLCMDLEMYEAEQEMIKENE